MIWQTIDIDGYWLATVIYVPQHRDMPSVAEALSSLGCTDNDISNVWHLVTRQWNKGFTWSNPRRRRSITIIGRATDWPQFFNTILHETKHLVDEITAAYDVMNYGEPPAYLQGFLGQSMAPAIRRIVCPCCGYAK